jgi:hypothetical protein
MVAAPSAWDRDIPVSALPRAVALGAKLSIIQFRFAESRPRSCSRVGLSRACHPAASVAVTTLKAPSHIMWQSLLARRIVNSTSARIGLVAFSLIFATVLLVVADVKAPKRTPTLEVWLLIQILALGGTTWATARAFTSVESRAKRMIARVAASVAVWLALLLGSYIVGVNLKLALGASL